jgi:hypothetical protein
MKVIEPGHVYELAEVDGIGSQTVRFVRRRDDNARLLSADEGLHPGILGQELLRVLINRTLYLNDEDPCQEDIEIVARLRECLRLYESRAARRTIEKMPMPERADACPICHHLLCDHRQPGRLRHEAPR